MNYRARIDKQQSLPVLLLAMATWAGAASGSLAAERIDLEGPIYEGEGHNVIAPFKNNLVTSTVRIRGNLNVPRNAAGPVPLVIIAHSAGGWGGEGETIKEAMDEAGFATLDYDSYAARNWENPSRGKGGPKLEAHQAADAYGALKVLQSNPRIDGRRIAIVGTSAGGNTALLAASETLHARYVGKNGPRFAALVALYPGGYLLPTATDSTAKTPILILPAEKDDFMKWERTKVWIDYVKRENPDVPLDVVMVPDAHHSFMNKSAPSGNQYNVGTPVAGTCPFALANFSTTGRAYLQLDGSISTQFDPACQGRGATTGYSWKAAQFAMEQTVTFLKRSFAAVD